MDCLVEVFSNSWWTVLQLFILKDQWAEMFSDMIGSSSTLEVISSGINGTKNCALQLVHILISLLLTVVLVILDTIFEIQNMHCRCKQRSKLYHHWSRFVK